MKTKAFTLIELLVVIAIIALLMAIILPALNSVKRKAAVTVCLSNTKNLSLGWYMYMGDNDGRIMHARDDAIVNGNFVGWCGVPSDAYGRRLSNTQTSPAVTDEDEIRGIKEGVLYPYVQDAGAYHCPADNIRKSIYDQTTVFVSYGVPACLGGQIRNFSQISRPATRYVFVESAETRNWNSSHHFVMATPEHDNLGKWGWWGPMAINHGDSSVLGFCDGHSEVRKWRDRFTFEHLDRVIAQGGGTYGRKYPPADQTQDIDYMAAGWPYRHNDR